MDRKGQLRNVAFGGDWAEMIEPRERLLEALQFIDEAVLRTGNEDLRINDQLSEAVAFASDLNIKGYELSQAWLRALSMENPILRQEELERVARLFRSGSAIG